MRKVIFFINPLRVATQHRRAILDQCAARLRDEGCTVEMQEAIFPDAGGTQARAAVENGFDTIFACGGDGTLFNVLQGAAGSDTAVGVIPMGTGNVLAQNMKLPRNPMAAFEAQRRAEAVSIPLGEAICEGPNRVAGQPWYFALAAGVGMHATVMALSSSGAGKRILGRAAYYAGGLSLLLRHPIRSLHVEVTSASGEVQRFRACEVLAVRVPRIGIWRSGASMHSPHLHMAAVPLAGRGGVAHACFHALFTRMGNRESRLCFPRYEEAQEIVCVPTVEDRDEDAPLLVEADGEVIGTGGATFRMSEKRVRLLWPRGSKRGYAGAHPVGESEHR